jgi:hypothetical protein
LRHRQTERLGGLAVHGHLEFDRQLNRQVGRLCATEDAIHIGSRAAKDVRRIVAIGERAAVSGKARYRTYRRYLVSGLDGLTQRIPVAPVHRKSTCINRQVGQLKMSKWMVRTGLAGLKISDGPIRTDTADHEALLRTSHKKLRPLSDAAVSQFELYAARIGGIEFK